VTWVPHETADRFQPFGNENLTDKPRDGMRIQTTVVHRVVAGCSVDRWALVAEGAVPSAVVVVLVPAAVERLDVAVAPGLAGWDEVQAGVFACPVDHRSAGEFGAVVAAQHGWIVVDLPAVGTRVVIRRAKSTARMALGPVTQPGAQPRNGWGMDELARELHARFSARYDESAAG
jgi:hypothetical protein